MNLLSTYDRFNQVHPAQGGLAELRLAALSYAKNQGLPTRSDENWHYTSVKVLNDVQFMPSAFNPSQPTHETLLEIKKRLNSEFVNLVFFNGILNKTLSDELPAGIEVCENTNPETNFQDTFEALNGAYQTAATVFQVKKEASVDKPVNFLFYTSMEGGPALMVHPRIEIKVGARSSVKLLESHYGPSGISYFVNSLFNLHVGDSAKVIYSRIQAEGENAINIGRTNITLEKAAQVESLVLATGAALSRHNLNIQLTGPGAHADVLGVYATRGSQHVDNTTVIDHQVGECDTNQLYKGILDEQSKAVFCGKVLIRKNAQKANSAQLNNNLLLSSKAEADSKPTLEIFADDVKASHGSTVGQMNAEELFYLLSRAIPKQKAITMLSYGYLSEVIYKISDLTLQKWLSSHLDQAFTHLHLESKS